MAEHRALDSDTLERGQKRGLSNLDFTGLTLHEDSRMTYEDLDIEDSIAITGVVDFPKTQRSFIAEYVQEACDTDTVFQATINRGDGFTAEKRRKAI